MRWQPLALAPFVLVALPHFQPDARALSIDGYKKWHVVNKRPVKMSAAVMALCVQANAKQLASIAPSSPHREYYLRVFVSNGGSHFADPKSVVAPGTIIVKEKLDGQHPDHPELFTIMRKREKGYDSSRGNWEYAVADKSRKIVEQGKLDRCITCHETQKASDYLYRSYAWSN